MWRSFLKLPTEPESEEEKKSVVEVLVQSPVKPLTPKKLWEKTKKAKMADGEVKALSKKRSQVKGKLTRILHAVQPSTQPGALPGAQAREADVLPPQLRVHQRSVEKYYGEFCEVHNMIMDLVEDDEGTKQQEAKWVEFEQLYNRTLVVLETLLTAHDRPIQAVLPAGQATQQVIIHQQALRAPLPTFDGRYENWAKFKAMFQDLMRSSPDSDAVKLYHLDKALVGEAEGKIDLRTIQDNNYQGAWKELEEQYENTRLIIDLHIQGILQLKKMDKRSSKELRDVVERCSRHVEGLRFHKQELLGVSELVVVNILASALDRETRELWEATIEKGELPTYQATVDFLRKRCHILERCELSDLEASAVTPTVPKMPSSTKPSVNVSAAATTTTEVVCELCGGNHPNYRCSAFCSMSIPQRLEKVREARACYNCLRIGHLVKKCPSVWTCKCGERHHNLLHMDLPSEQAPSKFEAAPQSSPTVVQAPSNMNSADSPEQTTSCCNSGLLQTSRPVLLQTAIVNVVDKHGRLHPCRTLLDSGSQAHILSAAMARKLELPLTKCNVTVIGANAVKTPARKSVSLNFSSRYVDFRDTISCLISEKPTGIIPSERINTSGWKIPNRLQLADPQFFESNDIDLVMASNYMWDLLRSDIVKLRNGTVTLRETDLGWIVTGTYDPCDKVSHSILHANVVRLDTLEEIVESTLLSAENEKVDNQVHTTHRRNENDRYVLQIQSPIHDTRIPPRCVPDAIRYKDTPSARTVLPIDGPAPIPEQKLRAAVYLPARPPILDSDGRWRAGDRIQKPSSPAKANRQRNLSHRPVPPCQITSIPGQIPVKPFKWHKVTDVRPGVGNLPRQALKLPIVVKSYSESEQPAQDRRPDEASWLDEDSRQERVSASQRAGECPPSRPFGRLFKREMKNHDRWQHWLLRSANPPPPLSNVNGEEATAT